MMLTDPIPEHLPRIVGVALQDNEAAVCWLSHDRARDVISVHDPKDYRLREDEVIQTIEGRGRWMPVSWSWPEKDIADRLRALGCNVLDEPVQDSDALRQVAVKDIQQRLTDGRFEGQWRLKEWFRDGDEFNPLMRAIFHAMAMMSHARRQETEPYGRDYRRNYPLMSTP